MVKPEKTVKRESLYIAVSVVLMTLLLHAVFLIIGKWSLPVLYGSLLGGGVAILNFYLLGLTVQSALQKESKPAAAFMRLSQTLRMLMMFIALLLGVALAFFNIWATVIPLLFPRIAILIRPLFRGLIPEDTDAK